jgi:hypothetical protein
VEGRRQQIKVEAPLGAGQSSIEREYKKILLLSLLDPQLLSKTQAAQLHANMALWLERVELISASERGEGMVGYCVRREADAPHANLTGECCHDCEGGEQAGLMLDLSGLNGFIAGQLEQARYGEPFRIEGKGGSEITRETLEILQQCWHTPELQRDERRVSDASAEVAIGINSIHQLLQQGSEVMARGISDQRIFGERKKLTFLDEGTEQAMNPGTVVGGRPQKDVWSTIFAATEVSQKSWAREAEERSYRFVPVHQRNYTAAGYGLEFDKANMESLQVGELLGYRQAAGEALMLCMVRWLNEDETQLSAGVMRLAASMEPALVVVRHQERDTALNCLLGIGEDQRPQLFLPHLPGILDKLGVKSLSAYVDSTSGWKAKLYDDLLRFVPVPKDQKCHDPVCHRITFMYSLLYEHQQLTERFHSNLHELFGVGNIKTFEHLAEMVREQVVVSHDGKDVYMPHLDRLALPIRFIHGAENRCYLPESTQRTYERLCEANGESLYDRFVIPRYGHIDCMFGKQAADDVFPLILQHLEETR